MYFIISFYLKIFSGNQAENDIEQLEAGAYQLNETEEYHHLEHTKEESLGEKYEIITRNFNF